MITPIDELKTLIHTKNVPNHVDLLLNISFTKFHAIIQYLINIIFSVMLNVNCEFVKFAKSHTFEFEKMI